MPVRFRAIGRPVFKGLAVLVTASQRMG
jgi:hypothetical protein